MDLADCKRIVEHGFRNGQKGGKYGRLHDCRLLPLPTRKGFEEYTASWSDATIEAYGGLLPGLRMRTSYG